MWKSVPMMPRMNLTTFCEVLPQSTCPELKSQLACVLSWQKDLGLQMQSFLQLLRKRMQMQSVCHGAARHLLVNWCQSLWQYCWQQGPRVSFSAGGSRIAWVSHSSIMVIAHASKNVQVATLIMKVLFLPNAILCLGEQCQRADVMIAHCSWTTKTWRLAFVFKTDIPKQSIQSTGWTWKASHSGQETVTEHERLPVMERWEWLRIARQPWRAGQHPSRASLQGRQERWLSIVHYLHGWSLGSLRFLDLPSKASNNEKWRLPIQYGKLADFYSATCLVEKKAGPKEILYTHGADPDRVFLFQYNWWKWLYLLFVFALLGMEPRASTC